MTTNTNTANTNTANIYSVNYWGDPKKCPTANRQFGGVLELIEFIAGLGEIDGPHSASIYKEGDPTWKGGNLYCISCHGWVSVSPSKEMTPWIWEYPEKSPAILPEDVNILMESVYASQRIRELEEEVKYLKDEVAARDAWEDMRGKPLPAPCLFIPTPGGEEDFVEMESCIPDDEEDFEERFPV